MIPAPITDHVSRGLALLTSQFVPESAPQLRALIAAYLGEVQLLEDAAWDVVNLRLLANLTIYSPLYANVSILAGQGSELGTIGAILGRFSLGSSSDSRTAYSNSDLTGIIIPGVSVIVFSSQPGIGYLVSGLDSSGTVLTLQTPYTGPDSTGSTATQNLTNPLIDTIGNLVGQPRNGDDDIKYLSEIYLCIAVNRSSGRAVDWSRFAAILSEHCDAIVYLDGEASVYFGAWNLGLDPLSVGAQIARGTGNGIGGVFAWSTWPDGADFEFDSVYDSAVGELGWGSVYNPSVGGLMVAGSAL